jgi:hypothetical protein
MVIHHPESRPAMPPFGSESFKSRYGDGAAWELSPSRDLDRERGFDFVVM